jgi:uncharacterized protein
MRFAGYAAVFDHPDRGGDVVRGGAFSRAIKPDLPILWQHDAKRQIGSVESLFEDSKGLRVIASLGPNAPPVKPGHGLSFGYRVRAMNRGQHRELLDLELIEISLVTHPMQPLARVLSVEPKDGENHGL